MRSGIVVSPNLRVVVTTIAISLTIIVHSACFLEAADISTGSGVVIGTHGEILTNAHVVEDCEKITAQLSSRTETAVLVARDQRNDLAVVRSNNPPSSVAAFREGAPLRAGDTVVAVGYPLSGLLATTATDVPVSACCRAKAIC
jgi:S1-C subfamily serine protease